MPSSTIKPANSASRLIMAALAAILAITALVLVLLQTVLPSLSGNKPLLAIKTYDEGYKEGFRNARELSGNAGALRERSTLTGTVTAISGSNITFTASGLIVDERADGVGLTRTVTVGAETRVLLRERAEAPQTRGSSPYETRAISVNEIKVGDLITVTATEDADLSLIASFTPATIEVTHVAAQPAPTLHRDAETDAQSDEPVTELTEE
jgi:hypothetical protein